MEKVITRSLLSLNLKPLPTTMAAMNQSVPEQTTLRNACKANKAFIR